MNASARESLMIRSLYAAGLAECILAEGPEVGDLIRNDAETYIAMSGEDGDLVRTMATILSAVTPAVTAEETQERYYAALTCYADTVAHIASQYGDIRARTAA